MKNVRSAAVFAATIGCAGVFAFGGSAAGDTFVCPDSYQPVPVIVLPPDGKIPDRNDNGIVCVKGPQGSNEHFNAKDDKAPQYVDDII